MELRGSMSCSMQALGHHLNLALALCRGIGHSLHQDLGHHLNLALTLCHGIGDGVGLFHGHRIGLGHAPSLSMSRFRSRY
jgi:hypothetical protein